VGIEHTTILADPFRVRQFYRIFETRGYLADAKFQLDSNGIPWLVKADRDFSVGVSLLKSGRWFTEHSRNHWAEEYNCKLEEIRSMTNSNQRDQLRLFARNLRFGALTTRLLWLVHSEVIRTRSTEIRIPTKYIRDMVWGDGFPKRWRQDLRTILSSVSALHISDEKNDSGSIAKFDDKTSILTHFNISNRGKNTECTRKCRFADRQRHEHSQIIVGLGFLGEIERLSNGSGSGGNRKIRLPSYDDDKKSLRENEKLLRKIGKSGRVSSIFMPAILGARDSIHVLSTSQRILFHNIFRERTRVAKKQKRAVAETEVISGNMLTSPSPTRNGRKASPIRCPYLADSKQYVGFNGNRVLKGKGYKVSTWSERMGYVSPAEFFDDLGHLVHFFDLIVVIVDPKSLSWIDLAQAQNQYSSRRSDIERRHLRIYSETDFESRWCAKLGWRNDELSSDEISRHALVDLIHNSEYSNSYWAESLEIDPSTLSKVVRGVRQCPQSLLANFNNLVETHGI
jgi:hypothetical protein